MVMEASKPLMEEIATGDQWIDLIKTPEVLQRVAAKTRNKTDFDLGDMGGLNLTGKRCLDCSS